MLKLDFSIVGEFVGITIQSDYEVTYLDKSEVRMLINQLKAFTIELEYKLERTITE